MIAKEDDFVIYRQTNGDLKVSENHFHNLFSKNEIHVLDFETNKKIFESNIFLQYDSNNK